MFLLLMFLLVSSTLSLSSHFTTLALFIYFLYTCEGFPLFFAVKTFTLQG